MLFSGETTMVDDDMYDSLIEHKWLYDGNYAARNIYVDGKRVKIYMHRVVNKTPKGFVTDHKNGDKLNNLRSNLRTVTQSENACNRSKYKKNSSSIYKGVYYSKRWGMWMARGAFGCKVHRIGIFDNELAAAYAYNKKMSSISECALLNTLDYPIEYLEALLLKSKRSRKSPIINYKSRNNGVPQSGIKGITWCNLPQRWRVAIMINGKKKYIALTQDIDEAKKALQNFNKTL